MSTKKQQKNLLLFLLSVGVARLERATACTPCKNASQLHHTPIAFNCVEISDSTHVNLAICGCKIRNVF